MSFVFAPNEVFMDRRLSLIQMRVLLALFSFRRKNTDTVYPKREKVAERTGYSVRTISRATTDLVELGWLKKSGDGGRKRPVHYTILCPETVPEPETVSESETVSELGTKTVPESDRGIEHDKEHDKQLLLAKPVSRSSKRKKIEVGWSPSSRCFDLITKRGIDLVFAKSLLDEFVLYWQDRGESRASWDSTFLNHVDRQHKRQSVRQSTGKKNAPMAINQGAQKKTTVQILQAYYDEKTNVSQELSAKYADIHGTESRGI